MKPTVIVPDRCVDSVQTAAGCRAVITGFGISTPLARTVEGLLESILGGRSSLGPVTRFECTRFTSRIASAFPPESDATFNDPVIRRDWMDRSTWYLIEAMREALDRSGLDTSDCDPTRVAVVLGSSHAGMVTTEEAYRAYLDGKLKHFPRLKLTAIPVSHPAAVAARALGALGPRITISSACASSTAAMGYALDLVRAGHAHVVIVGGTDTVSQTLMAGFNALRSLSGEPCAPFSTPSGINLGEGAGVLVVERLDRALDRGAVGEAEILGYGLSGDAHHATAPEQTGDGVRQVLEEALKDAGLPPQKIDYLSAHGTGTDANDIAESRGTAKVFGRSVPISSCKSFLGHTLGASGVIETIITLVAARRGMLPPTANFVGLRQRCEDLDYVPGTPRAGRIRRLVCNNYGFGGNNASVVLDRNCPAESPSPAVGRALAKPVFIVGIGCHCASGTGMDVLESSLQAGTNFLKPTDPGKANGPWIGTAPVIRLSGVLRRFGRVSPMIKFALQAVADALSQAPPVDVSEQTALIMGVLTGAQHSTEKFMETSTGKRPELASAHHFPMTTMNACGGQVSIAFNLKGYNATFCGSPSALAYANLLLAERRQRRAVVCSSDELSPLLVDFYHAAGCLRSDGAALPFDGKPGISLAEGAVALVLDCKRPIESRGVRIAASAEAQDAKLNGVRNDGAALARAGMDALARAGIEPGDVDVIFVSGVGPGRFPAAERTALRSIFQSCSKPTVVSGLGATGYGPSHAPLLNVAVAARALEKGNLPMIDAGFDELRCALVGGFDMLGGAYAFVLLAGET
jgi:3-oxoacyl-[acyl-carrier-protein] synthase II